MKSDSTHWNQIFREMADEKLGWYENDPAQTVRLLQRIPGWEKATLFLPGAGTSILVDVLLDAGAQLILNDISQEALDHLAARLGERGGDIEWICQDMARPLPDMEVDIWIDRAVLHFLTAEADMDGYFKNVRASVRVGGHALFAEFPPHGVPKCAGLELHRYTVEELAERLGSGFRRVECFDHTYISPSGDLRPYIYSLFERV